MYWSAQSGELSRWRSNGYYLDNLEDWAIIFAGFDFLSRKSVTEEPKMSHFVTRKHVTRDILTAPRD